MTLGRAARACGGIGLLLAAPAAAENPPHGAVSVWSTNHGRLELEAHADGAVRGTYGESGGTIAGSQTPEGVVAAVWAEDGPGRRCDEIVRGTRYWGMVVWRLDRDGRMTGRWSYCNEPLGSAGPWHGTFVDGTTPLGVRAAGATPPGGDDAGAAPPPLPPPPPPGRIAPADVGWDEAAARLRARFGDRPALDDPERLRVDFTCDGGLDVVTGWMEPDNAGMRAFRLLLVHRRGVTLRVHEEALPLGGDPGRPTTCTTPGVAPGGAPLGPRTGGGLLTALPLDPGDAAQRGLPDRCGTRIRLRDPLCGGGLDLFWTGAGVLYEETAGAPGDR